jgi:hypothetical protein
MSGDVPTRIRCTGTPLPYYIGNRWFGGLPPAPTCTPRGRRPEWRKIDARPMSIS